MTLSLTLLREARAEFDEAFDWYEIERPGRGVAFDASVRETFGRIADRPRLYQIVVGDIRRAPVRRFPYVIYYRVELQRIVVLSVFHTSRDPKIWQSRM